MEDKELMELYKQRNEFAKAGDINQTENITNLITQELPTKISKRGFRDSNGKPVQFEIVGWSRHNDLDMDGGYWLGGCNDATINGKIVYRRILIRRKFFN